jgi:orotidine-5'-phosphate decarboxylase
MAGNETYEALLGGEFEAVRRRSYVALDVPSYDAAKRLVDDFGDVVDGYKVGLQLFYADGSRTLELLLKKRKRVFLDVKLHDIPNTVAGAMAALCAAFPIEMVNVHAMGGLRMMEAARRAVDGSRHRPLLIGVTVLTSMDTSELLQVGVGVEPRDQVLRLAQLTKTAGLDGIVASAEELPLIRAKLPPDFVTVIPGTRMTGSATHDQRRTLTPGQAMSSGASHLVLGRAITEADDKLSALHSVWTDMKQGMKAGK